MYSFGVHLFQKYTGECKQNVSLTYFYIENIIKKVLIVNACLI